MSRFTRFLILAVAACGFALPSSAIAADPVPTTTRVHFQHPGSDLVITANVTSKSGVPTGSVTFFKNGNPDPLGAPVPLNATGAASITLPNTPDWPLPYTAQFVGTNGYADSTGTPSLFGESVKMTPIGTILRIGGPGLLQITQTFSVRAKYASDGVPATGEVITFTQKNKMHGQSGHPEMDPNYVYPVPVCTAVVDATGYATCTGTSPMSALVTLLTTSAWANHELFPTMETAYLPILSVG